MTPYEFFLQNIDHKELTLADPAVQWNKSELLAAIETLSQKFQLLGLKSGDRVGVSLGKSVFQVAAMLALWKNDLVYVPISHKNPAERLEYIVTNCDLSLLVVLESQVQTHGQVPLLKLSDKTWDFNLKLSNPTPISQNVSYIIYTSGTTGQPKGVVIENSAIGNFFQAITEEKFPFEMNKEVILQLVDFSFDVSFWDLGVWFLYGGKLVITDFLGNAINLIKTLVETKVSVLTAAAPTYAILLSNKEVLKRFDLSGLKFLVTTASYCPPRLAQDILEYFDRVTLYNCYGPTETTVYCTWTQVKKDSVDLTKPLSIGHLLHGLEASFFEDGKITPLQNMVEGKEAELLIQGAQLFSHYWMAEALTAEKVLVDNGVRYYRTGDLASRSGDQLFYHGRTDDTIKVNGHRVNLGEIEMVAGEIPWVSHNIVIEKVNEKFQTELFLFYTKAPGSSSTEQVEEALREMFLKKLPQYMHPKRMIQLEYFPVSIAGKIDKKALRVELKERI